MFAASDYDAFTGPRRRQVHVNAAHAGARETRHPEASVNAPLPAKDAGLLIHRSRYVTHQLRRIQDDETTRTPQCWVATLCDCMRNGRGGTRAREFSCAVVRRAITARLAVLRTVAPAGADGDVGSIGVTVG